MEDKPHKSTLEIRYCTQCRWLLRAAWMAQELLTSFEEEIGALTLTPGTGGIFEVWADGRLIWSRKAEGRFPGIVALKQRVRDAVAPDKSLGHVDRAAEARAESKSAESRSEDRLDSSSAQ